MKEAVLVPNRETHLAPGIRPIIVCLLSDTDPEDANSVNYITQNFRGSRLSRNVDFYSPGEGTYNNGDQTYVMSSLDDLDKYSEGYANCVGLVISGIDKVTGRNLSFLSHQDPRNFLELAKEDFLNHLQKSLQAIAAQCMPGTIDSVIIGGVYVVGYKKDYIDAIKLLTEENKKILGFEPVVVNGPKFEPVQYPSEKLPRYGRDKVYFDNEKRKLYLIRPKVNSYAGDFTGSNIETEEKKWRWGRES